MPPRFHHLQRSHFFKNAFCVVLEACITDMHQGRAVHTLSLKTVFDQDSYVESSVIDINLLQVWQHRRSKESIQEFIYAQLGCLECHDDGICPAWFLSRIFFYLFNKMPQFGREPDGTTYLGVFSHAAMEGS
jgi:hypothetical protein